MMTSEMANRIPELVANALRAQESECREGEAKNAALQELIDHPSQEVFDAAAQLCHSGDRHHRLLGVRVLRELGRAEMPFADRATDLLKELIRKESDPELLRWEVSALGNQRRSSALPILLDIAGHPDVAVRYAVAGAISGANEGDLDDRSIDALVQLTSDSDSDVRFSAVFELASWFEYGAQDARIKRVLEHASVDSDSRLSRVARDALGNRDKN